MATLDDQNHIPIGAYLLLPNPILSVAYVLLQFTLMNGTLKLGVGGVQTIISL